MSEQRAARRVLRCPIPLGAALALGVVLRFLQLDAEPLRGDEGFTFLVAIDRGDWLARVAGDPHPLSFYALCRLLAPLITVSDGAFRLPAALASCAALLLWPRWLRLRGFETGFVTWASLLFAVLPVHVWFAQEARAYAFVHLVAVLVLIGYERARLSPEPRALALLALATAVSSHFDVLGVVVPALLIAHTMRLALTSPPARRVLAALLAGGASSLPYHGWRLSLLVGGHALHVASGERAGLRLLAEHLVQLSPLADLEGALHLPRKAYVALAVLVLVCVVPWSRRSVRRWTDRDGLRLLWTLAIGPPVLFTIASELGGYGAVTLRYLLTATLGLVPLFVLGLTRLGRGASAAAWLLCGIVPLGLTGAQLVHFASERDDWRTFYRAIAGQRHPGDGFIRRGKQNWDGWALGRVHAYAWQSGEPLDPADALEFDEALVLGKAAIVRGKLPAEDSEATTRLQDFLARHPRVWLVSSVDAPDAGAELPGRRRGGTTEQGGIRATDWLVPEEGSFPAAAPR